MGCQHLTCNYVLQNGLMPVIGEFSLAGPDYNWNQDVSVPVSVSGSYIFMSCTVTSRFELLHCCRSWAEFCVVMQLADLRCCSPAAILGSSDEGIPAARLDRLVLLVTEEHNEQQVRALVWFVAPL